MADTPAGWYPDPEVPDRQRFWDGTRWTSQVTRPPSLLGLQPPAFWVGLACCLLMVIGSFGPWVTALFITVTGLDRQDGFFVITVAAVAALVLYLEAAEPDRVARRLGIVLPVTMGLIGVVIGIAAFADFKGAPKDVGGDFIQIGWGLYLVIAASVGLVISSALFAWQN